MLISQIKLGFLRTLKFLHCLGEILKRRVATQYDSATPKKESKVSLVAGELKHK
jgi:hypothetical protein